MSLFNIILGGPGCGKTTALLDVVHDALKTEEPETIAYLAFTRKASIEARTRAGRSLGVDIDRLVWFRTIHSMAFHALGLLADQVMGAADYKELGEALHLDFGTGAEDNDFGLHLGATGGEQLARLEQLCRVTGDSLEWAAPRQGIDIFKARHYVQSLYRFKRERSLIDFTDMIELFNTSVGQRPLMDVKTVIVDEAQDLSAIHWAALQPLLERADNVYIGGDDDQSIFRWAGADIDHFINLEGATRVLPVSHRLPRKIYDIANRILNRINARRLKEWEPREEPGEIIRMDSVDSLGGECEEGSWLFLARHNYQLAAYVEYLRWAGYSYEMYGKSSTDTDYASAISTWKNLQKGQKVKAEYVKIMLKLTKHYTYNIDGVPDHRLINTQNLKESLVMDDSQPWHKAFINMPELEIRYYKACLSRIEKVGHGSLWGTPRIKVSTIHGAKGGEADHVVLCPDMSRKAFAALEDPETADDEHRVFYVGVTRAKKRLFILHPRGSRYYAI